jgi:hypothetical protein
MARKKTKKTKKTNGDAVQGQLVAARDAMELFRRLTPRRVPRRTR